MQEKKNNSCSQKKIESESVFNFLSRVEKICVSNFCLRSRVEVCVSWGLIEARVDFNMKNFKEKYLSNGLLQNELRQTV